MLKLAKNDFILFYFLKSGSFRKTALTAQQSVLLQLMLYVVPNKMYIKKLKNKNQKMQDQ